MASSTMPQWATPERRQALVDLFHRSRGFCVYGHEGCRNPDHNYEWFIEGLIKDWQSDDRQEQAALWEVERKAIHSLGEKVLPLRGRFSAVSREVYHDAQPLYYLIGLGMSGVTKRPFAKVRLASSYLNLHIDLGDSLRPMSKNKRRKAIRYGGNFPIECERKVNTLIHAAIMHHRAH